MIDRAHSTKRKLNEDKDARPQSHFARCYPPGIEVMLGGLGLSVPRHGALPCGPSWARIHHAAQEQDRAGVPIPDKEDEGPVDRNRNGLLGGA